jgi:hypothetical protein
MLNIRTTLTRPPHIPEVARVFQVTSRAKRLECDQLAGAFGLTCLAGSPDFAKQ